MRLQKLLAALTLLTLANTVYAGYYEGVRAFDEDNYKLAWQNFAPLAKQGDARAQSYIALMYEHGRGIPIDLDEAEMWKKIAVRAALEESTESGNTYGTQENALDLGKLCAIVREFPVGKVEVEEELIGKDVQYEVTATARSKQHDGLLAVANYQECGACEAVTLGFSVWNANAKIPVDIKLKDKVIVNGRITSAALWANGFEGCYIHMDATSIESNGF